MIAQASIRTAQPAEMEVCLQTLTRAFETDPICRWVWPEKAVYQELFPRFSQAFGGAAVEAGSAHLYEEGKGVALWLKPGSAPDDESFVELTRATAPERLQVALFSLFEQMDSYHPREPHWHLPLIGVDPGHQGRGIGSALLQHALRVCDEEQCLSYLEATSPANMRLYERHGFEAIGFIQAGDSPPIIPMTRTPRRVVRQGDVGRRASAMRAISSAATITP